MCVFSYYLSDSNSKDGEKGDGQCTHIVTEDAAALMTTIGAMKAFRHCPFRLYFSPVNLKTAPPTKGFIQTLISPFKESDGAPITFRDAIDSLFDRIRTKNFHPDGLFRTVINYFYLYHFSKYWILFFLQNLSSKFMVWKFHLKHRLSGCVNGWPIRIILSMLLLFSGRIK